MPLAPIGPRTLKTSLPPNRRVEKASRVSRRTSYSDRSYCALTLGGTSDTTIMRVMSCLWSAIALVPVAISASSCKGRGSSTSGRPSTMMAAAAAVFSRSLSQESRMPVIDGTKIRISASMTKATVRKRSRVDSRTAKGTAPTSAGGGR